MAEASAQEHALCDENRNKVRSVGAETFLSVVVLMNVSTKIYERRGLLSIAEALALMISFGSFIATLIFGILEAVKEDNKNNRQL